MQAAYRIYRFCVRRRRSTYIWVSWLVLVSLDPAICFVPTLETISTCRQPRLQNNSGLSTPKITILGYHAVLLGLNIRAAIPRRLPRMESIKADWAMRFPLWSGWVA